MRAIINIFLLSLLLSSCGGTDSTKDTTVHYLTPEQVEVLLKTGKASQIDVNNGAIIITDSTSVKFNKMYIFTPRWDVYEEFDFK